MALYPFILSQLTDNDWTLRRILKMNKQVKDVSEKFLSSSDLFMYANKYLAARRSNLNSDR